MSGWACRFWPSPASRLRPRLMVQRASVSICAPRFRPFRRRAAALERVFLGFGKVRPARRDHRGVDDLTTHGEIALAAQDRVEPLEQALEHAGARQLLAEQPDRLRIRHRLVGG